MLATRMYELTIIKGLSTPALHMLNGKESFWRGYKPGHPGLPWELNSVIEWEQTDCDI